MLKVATWNVNSIKVRLAHVSDWLKQHSPEVLCLQETKSQDENFPLAAFEAFGYQVLFAGQKTFNGVAILSKQVMTDPVYAFPDYDDPQKRVLAATYGDVRVVNLYIPNGSEVDSEKYDYKLTWLSHLKTFLMNELKRHEKIVVVGDFNIAPEDRDVHDPEKWQGGVLVSPKEREVFQGLIDLGFVDVFRLFEQAEKSYSWWDYRAAAFRRNHGLRIDHILATQALASTCVSSEIDKEPRLLERPSDHAPVLAEFAI